MRSPEQLRILVEEYLGDLALTPELHGQAESVRYALVGGKRVRAVICLATVEGGGGWHGALGSGRAGGRAGSVARVRRRARTAVPDRRRHPRRRRLCPRTRRRRRSCTGR